MQGIISYVNFEKGYGFINIDGYEKGVFFHIKDFTGSSFENLQKGEEVSIEEIENTTKGNAAKGVRII